MSKPSTAVTGRTRTGTYGDMPFPITLIPTPQKVVQPRTVTQKTLATPLYINLADHLKNKFIWDADGEIIYPMVRNALSQGRKVIISIKGFDVNGGFWDTAVCKAYGEFPEEVVDQNIQVVDGDEVDDIYLRDMKDIRKLYYYDRETYDEIMDNVDPILGYDEPLSDDFVFLGTDKHAPYDSSLFYRKSDRLMEDK